MTAVKGFEVAEWAEEAMTAYSAERRRLTEANEKIERELEQLAARELQVWEQLTVTLVPGLVAEHLDWAANLLHLPTIAAAQVQQRIAAEREAIAAELARIEADPEYTERELRLNECEIRIDELDRSIDPLRQSTSALELELYFGLLVEVDYDTPAYPCKWYELDYYRHWKWGDEIVERHGEPRGLERFADLRARYEEEREARRTLEGERARWVSDRSRITALATRHKQMSEALATIEERYWTQTRAQVHEHLSELESDDLLKLLESYEPGLYAAKRIAGIAAKRRYLRALHHEWISKPLTQVKRKAAKAERGMIKYRRSKNYYQSFDRDSMRRKYQIPRAAWDKRWCRTDVAYQRIVDFDRYDDYSLADDVIWWHLMTGGEVKARFIPDVERYYDHRSSRAHDDDDAHELAVAALADEAMSTGGDELAMDDWS